MKKHIALSLIALAFGATVPNAGAQDFSVKAYGDIGLGKGISVSNSLTGMTNKSSSNAFGVGFGYTFWRLGSSSLEANIGLGYRTGSVKFTLPSLDYSYAAPATADEDGNAYVRHVSLSDLHQNINVGYLDIPLYLQYQYRFNKWVGVHAEAGFGFGFKCAGKLRSVSGEATAYGVYPEYDNLVIQAPYLNYFGVHKLSGAVKGKPSVKGFSAALMCGAGVEVYVYDPVSIDLGIRYNAGLTNMFKRGNVITPSTTVTEQTAPVTYTVADGQIVKALSDYTSKSKLNSLSLHIGINVRF